MKIQEIVKTKEVQDQVFAVEMNCGQGLIGVLDSRDGDVTEFDVDENDFSEVVKFVQEFYGDIECDFDGEYIVANRA